jgi:hypothetical protein
MMALTLPAHPLPLQFHFEKSALFQQAVSGGGCHRLPGVAPPKRRDPRTLLNFQACDVEVFGMSADVPDTA